MDLRFGEEIREQPVVAQRLLAEASGEIGRAAAAIRAAQPAALCIAARGTSDHAATYGKYLFEIRNRLPVALAAPSAFTLYQRPPRLDRLAVVAISQSGSSPDITAVLLEARRQGAVTIAITNEPGSELAAAADHVLLCRAGPERSVPASKTYTASLLLLALLSGALDPEPAFGAGLADVPGALEVALTSAGPAGAFARAVEANRMAVLGRGFHLATAQEIALKVTETSYLMTEARSVADFLHGPIAVVEPGLPVLLLQAAGPAFAPMRDVAGRLLERGARLLTFSDAGADEEPAGGGETLVPIRTGLPEGLTPLPYAVAGQLFACELAVHRGLDPDAPRGLTKVTRTR